MTDDRPWWAIEGETTGERIRNGLPQLLVVSVIAWLVALGTYRVVAAVIDPITAGAVLLLGGLYVGGRLRAALVVDDELTDAIEGEEPQP